MKKILITAGAILAGWMSYAQTDTVITIETKGKLKFIGFADAYYTFDFNNTNRTDRGILINGRSPFYSHTAHNQFSINNVIFGAKYDHDRFRASAIFHTGTYVQKNYAAEPEMTKHIYEALAGIRVCHNLWLDAGIFTSHIGLESAISKDNITLSRSLMAENTPYYESGAKLTYTTNNGKWLFSGLVLNGWQTIQSFQRPQKAMGIQIQFKSFGDKLLLNSSTYFGPAPIPTYTYDTAGAIVSTDLTKGGDFVMRYFHNFYFTYQLTGKLLVASGFDIGWQERSTTDKTLNTWFNPTLWAKYKLTNSLGINGRVEHYNDKTGVIIGTGSPNNFQATGVSLGLDYSPVDYVILRIEGRTLSATDKVFLYQQAGRITNNCTFVVSSIAVSLP